MYSVLHYAMDLLGNNIFASWILPVVVLVATTIYIAIKYSFKSTFNYWSNQNIPYIKSNSLFGNISDIVCFKKCAAEALQALYEDPTTKSQPVTGIRIFHKPGLLIRDLELVKRILVKDFNYFSNRYTSSDPHSDSLGSYNLFFVKNPLWKQIRTNLTPIFTSGKMKQFFVLMDKIGKQLDIHLNSLTQHKNHVSEEIREICALFTTDVIASTAYGVEANSISCPNSEFRKNGRDIFKFTIWRAFEFSSFFFIPQIVSFCRAKVFSQESTKFLRSTFNYIIEEREKTKIPRNDLIDLLISMKNSSKLRIDNKEIKMEGDILVSQAAVFFTAGYETTSSTMSFGLYELARVPDLQKRLREEIRDVLVENKGEITYDIILNMKYLHMIIQEVLRLYPPLPFLDRQCEAMSSNKTGGYSLEPVIDFVVPDQMPVYIPIYAIQRDEKYFPNPNKFDPERFAPENKDNIVPYSYMPFGTGGRVCIGERFGMMQAKIGLFYFLKNHYVKASPKTHKTMKFEKKALIIQSDGGIYCDVVRDPLVH